MPDTDPGSTAGVEATPSPSEGQAANALLEGAGDPGGGVELSIDIPETDPSSTPQTPVPGDVSAEVESLRRELETANKRVEDNQQWARTQNEQAVLRQQQVDAYQAQAQRDTQSAEMMKHLQPPPEPSDEDWDDPKVVKKYVQDHGKYVQRYTAAMLMPQVREVNRAAEQLGSVQEFMVQQALDAGAEDVEDIMPGSQDDYFQMQNEIVGRFSSMGDEGLKLMLKPGQIRNAYLILKAERGEPIAPAAMTPIAPSLPSRKDQVHSANSRLSKITAQNGDLVSEVLGKFGISDTKISETDLSMLEEGGLG